MNNGAFGENFPYSNFHDLNMDWIIKIAKDFLDQYTHIQEVIANGEQSLTDLTADGLEQLQEVIANGEQSLTDLTADGLEQLQAKANDLENLLQQWYNTHSNDIATQLTNAIIEFNQLAEQKGLSVIASIPDDYTAVANTAERTHNNVLRYSASNLLNMMEDYTFSGTYYGVSIVYDPNEDCFILNGTSTQSGNVNIYTDSTRIIDGLKTGQPFITRLTRNNVNITAEVFAYYNSTWNNIIQITYLNTYGTVQRILPTDTTGMLIRFNIPNGTTFNNEKVKLEIFHDFQIVYNGIVGSVATIGANTDVIEYFLRTNSRVCFIDSGEHKLDRTLNMVYGSSLIGLNYNNSILIPPDSDVDCIKIENVARTLISNLNIRGLVENIGDNPTNFGCGIRIIGHDTANEPRLNIIEKCQIHFFQGGGIVLDTNSYWVANSATIDNCELWRNFAGIWTKAKSEYNRISNCLIYSNYIGILNNGGNNKFINCDITENNVGFYITTDATINNGHGSMIGCSINHNNSNNGFAFILRNVGNGFIINGCNIWYGKIIASDSSGIVFSNCIIGNAQTPEIQSDNNPSLLFNGCTFVTSPTIVQYQSNTIFNNCYTFDGTPVT